MLKLLVGAHPLRRCPPAIPGDEMWAGFCRRRKRTILSSYNTSGDSPEGVFGELYIVVGRPVVLVFQGLKFSREAQLKQDSPGQT